MNKKMALFRHEMRTMIWFMLGGVLAALLFCYFLNTNLSARHLHAFSEFGLLYEMDCEMEQSFTSILSVQIERAMIVGVLVLVVMGIVQFSGMHNRKTQEYLHSLSFTKGECLMMKVLTGYMTLAVTMVVAVAGVLLLRSKYIGMIQKNMILNPFYEVTIGNDTIWHTLEMLAVMCLALFAVYSILIFTHVVVNKSILGGIIGFGIAAAPAWLFEIARMLLDEAGKSDAVDTWLTRNQHYFGVLIGQAYTAREYYENLATIIVYENFWILTAICVVVMVICLASAFVLTKRMDLAKGGMLVQRRSVRIFLSAGIGICFGTAIGRTLFYIGLSDELNFAAFIIVSAIMAVLIFFYCEKIFHKVFS